MFTADETHGASLARGLVWSLGATFLAAAFLIPYRYAVASAPRLAAMTAMFVVAAIFSAGVASIQARGARPSLDRVTLTTAIALALWTVLGNLGIALALPDIGTGMTSVVLKAQVILTPMLAIWFLKERASSRLWFGAILAMAGVAIPQVVTRESVGDAMGYAAAFVAAVAFSGMQLVTRRVITRIEPAVVNSIRLVLAVGVLQCIPDGRGVWSLSADTWGFAAAAGVLGPGLSRLCLMAALRHVSPSLTALVALLGPVLAFGLGYVFFSEAPTVLEVAGAGLILLGVLNPLWPRKPVISKS